MGMLITCCYNSDAFNKEDDYEKNRKKSVIIRTFTNSKRIKKSSFEINKKLFKKYKYEPETSHDEGNYTTASEYRKRLDKHNFIEQDSDEYIVLSTKASN